MDDMDQTTVSKLVYLRAKLDELTVAVSEIISQHTRAANTSCLHCTPIPTKVKSLSVAKRVRHVLQVAGREGATTEEIIRLLSKPRAVNAQTVRSALNRSKKAGTARRAGRRWYLAKAS